VREGSGSGSLPHNHSAGPRSSQVASHLATEISALADRHGFDWKAIGERGLAETPRGSGVEYEMTSFGQGLSSRPTLGTAGRCTRRIARVCRAEVFSVHRTGQQSHPSPPQEPKRLLSRSRRAGLPLGRLQESPRYQHRG
jgi:hypothetical protein